SGLATSLATPRCALTTLERLRVEGTSYATKTRGSPYGPRTAATAGKGKWRGSTTPTAESSSRNRTTKTSGRCDGPPRHFGRKSLATAANCGDGWVARVAARPFQGNLLVDEAAGVAPCGRVAGPRLCEAPAGPGCGLSIPFRQQTSKRLRNRS